MEEMTHLITFYTYCFVPEWTAKLSEDLWHWKPHGVSRTKLTASFFFLFLQYHCEEVQTKGTALFDPKQNNWKFMWITMCVFSLLLCTGTKDALMAAAFLIPTNTALKENWEKKGVRYNRCHQKKKKKTETYFFLHKSVNLVHVMHSDLPGVNRCVCGGEIKHMTPLKKLRVLCLCFPIPL